MNKRYSKEKVKPYIPDSTQADEWLSEDTFVYCGMKYKILHDGTIIKMGRDGKGSN